MYEVKNTLASAGQRAATDKHNEEHHVREQSGEVRSLAGTLNTLSQHYEEDNPGEEKAEGEAPLWEFKTVQACVVDLQHFSSVEGAEGVVSGTNMFSIIFESQLQ